MRKDKRYLLVEAASRFSYDETDRDIEIGTNDHNSRTNSSATKTNENRQEEQTANSS